MEQIFLVEIFVNKIVLEIKKDPEELAREEARQKEAEEAARLAEEAAAKKGKKGKGKGKEPIPPSPEEAKFLSSCSVSMKCPPLFELMFAHDTFVEPLPAAKNEKKPKGGAAKGKKGKGGVPPVKLRIPTDPLPDPPNFGIGNAVMFLCRPAKMIEILKLTPIHMEVWNRDENMNCIGFVVVNWDDSFFETINKAAEINPIKLDGNLRDTTKPIVLSHTVAMERPLQCDEDLKDSGLIDFTIRLSCLGNKVVTNVIGLPEMERIPARKYIIDDYHTKDIEAIRNWEASGIENFPTVAYLFGAVDINQEPVDRPKEIVSSYDPQKSEYTDDELIILSMGFPKGPCGGTNCPRRYENLGDENKFIEGEMIDGEYRPGTFVNKRDIHGPCARLNCPLAKAVRLHLLEAGVAKPCQRPCPKDYY